MGIFDGLHRGHKQIIRRIVKVASRIKGRSIILTFHPHPLKILFGKRFLPLLMSLEHRIRILKHLEVDVCIVVDFNKRFSKITADRFIKEVITKICPYKIIVGENFTFGKNSKGNSVLLRKMASEFGFKIESVPLFKIDGKTASSTYIRSLIQNGNLKAAQRLLGRPYSVLGEVSRNRGMGRKLGFPTANLDYDPEVIPPDGVYLVKIILGRRTYSGLCNIGSRPTFFKAKKRRKSIEVHILGFKRYIYRKNLEVQFIKRVRPEKKFPSREQLIRQLEKDRLKALQYFPTTRPTQHIA